MDQSAAIGSPPRRRRKRRDRRRVSEMLRTMIAAHPEPRINIWQLRDTLADRAYGVLLFMFAFPNLVPLPPGVSTVLAVPLIFIAVQFIFGVPHPYFPAWLGCRSFNTADFLHAFDRIRPSLRWVERLLQPRLLWATTRPAERVIAFACVILALVMALPIPFGHELPALAICVMALAVLERDGLFLLAGLGIGAGSVALYGAVLEKLAAALYHILIRLIGG